MKADGKDQEARTARHGIHPRGLRTGRFAAAATAALKRPTILGGRPVILSRRRAHCWPGGRDNKARAVISYCRRARRAIVTDTGDASAAPPPRRCIVMFMTTSRGFASNYPPLNVRLGPALYDVEEGFRIN